MNEVTENNFKKFLPEVEKALKDAAFISIDSEFTGLKSQETFKESLFDTVEDRYTKLRGNIEPFIIIQYGITAFQRVPDENEYVGKSFNFFLLPRSTPFRNRQFAWQVSALEFLSVHKFNFNKFAYDGISYMNEIDEDELRQQLRNGDLTRGVQRYVSYKDEDDLRDYKIKVGEWLAENSQENTYTISPVSPILQYLMHKEFRTRFRNVWTVSGDKSVIVMKVSNSTRAVLEEEEGTVLEDALLDTYIGFSRIFKLLVELKKPIVGHNVLLDLMFLHQQFHKPLPKQYSTFKNTIHKLFPVIYDTKHLSFELREMLEKKEKWKTNSLGAMYEYFKIGKGIHLALNSPHIKLLGNSDNTDDKNFHNAGWDAYYAGYIFIKMSYVFAVKEYGPGLENRMTTHTELMSAVKNYANCINMIRCSLSHLKVDGPDPAPTKPEWFYVKSLKSEPLNLTLVAEKFSAFGTIDVMPCTKQHVLVAVSNYESVRDISRHFQYNTDLYVVPYSAIRHTIPRKLLLWGSVILSGGMFAWVVHRTMKKVSYD